MGATTVRQAVEKRKDEVDISVQRDLTLREAIRAAEPGFKMALPKHVGVDRFMRTAMSALQTNPKLGQATQTSVLGGLMQAAQLGLEINDVRGQCYLIPRKNGRLTRQQGHDVYEASFQLGYRGMIDLAARSGIVVSAEEIRQNDEFDYALGTSRFLKHKPTLGPRGEVVAYYATADFADGRIPAFAIMSVAEVEEHRDKFASQRNYDTKAVEGPWVDHFDAMARKTVIRALLNYLPVSVEMRDVVQRDVIEAVATTSDPIDLGWRMPDMTGVELPEGVDSATGELADPTRPPVETTATEVSPNEEPG